MAVELEVYLRREKLPDASALERGLRDAGFKISFGKEPPSLSSHSGYLPLEFEGEESGFEFDVLPVDHEHVSKALTPRIGEQDSVATFRFTGEDELGAACAVSAVLAQLSAGLLYDPSEEAVSEPEEALKTARALAAERSSARARAAAAKRTPGEWAKMCLTRLKTVNPAYERSKRVKGRFLEYMRCDEAGLYLSHNFIHIRNTYHQGFAVLFSASQPSERLATPLLCGGRFDHNHDVKLAFWRDLKVPRRNDPRFNGWTSMHEWRSNTPELVERCFRAAEAHLLPHYRAILARGAESMIRLFATAQELIGKLNLPEKPDLEEIKSDPFAPVYAKAMHLGLDKNATNWQFLAREADTFNRAQRQGIDAKHILEVRRHFINLKATALALPDVTPGLPPGTPRDVAVVLCNIDDFFAVRGELPRMIEVLRRLAETG